MARAIDACLEAAKAGMVCSDACAPLADAFGLEACRHRTRAASDLCWATAIALLHADAEEPTLAALVEACRLACEASFRVCAPHSPHHEFCRLCERACRDAADRCAELLPQLAAEPKIAETGP